MKQPIVQSRALGSAELLKIHVSVAQFRPRAHIIRVIYQASDGHLIDD
jgi:hypothetical protein